MVLKSKVVYRGARGSFGKVGVNGEGICKPPIVIGNKQFQFTLVTGLSRGDSGPAGLQNAEMAILLGMNVHRTMISSNFLQAI